MKSGQKSATILYNTGDCDTCIAIVQSSVGITIRCTITKGGTAMDLRVSQLQQPAQPVLFLLPDVLSRGSSGVGGGP